MHVENSETEGGDCGGSADWHKARNWRSGRENRQGQERRSIVEKVMTSDSFLSREIKKAPLVEHDGSLVADISHIPNDLKITIRAHESTT